MATAASSGLKPHVIPVWPIFSRRLVCAETAAAARVVSPGIETNVRRSIWWDIAEMLLGIASLYNTQIELQYNSGGKSRVRRFPRNGQERKGKAIAPRAASGRRRRGRHRP